MHQSASKQYEVNGRRYRYRYRAVTSGGCGVHSKDYVSLASARRTVQKIKGAWPDAEIQRVRENLVGDDDYVQSRQYDLERNGKWVPEHKVRDPMTTDAKWEPTVKPIIVCAANKMPDGNLILGPRHWDTTMRATVMAIYGRFDVQHGQAEQGFVDQFGRFYNREEAMQVAQQNDQIRFPDDMLSQTALHSEDLY